MQLCTNYVITADVMNVYYSDCSGLSIEDSNGQTIEIDGVELSHVIRCFRNLFCASRTPDVNTLDSCDKRYLKELAEKLTEYTTDYASDF